MEKSTQHNVFLVPEILASFLIELPMQSLPVNAQRVCRAWKRIIDSSAALQQTLFFQSRPISPTSDASSYNELLQRAFPPWFREKYDACRGDIVTASLTWGDSPTALAAHMRKKDASWRKMLPCQPARTILEVSGKENWSQRFVGGPPPWRKRGFFETNGHIHFEDGVRMGALYDMGCDVAKERIASFWICWDESKVEQPREVGVACQVTERERLTMMTDLSWPRIGPGVRPAIEEQFWSEAYSELDIHIHEISSNMWWFDHFGALPRGGWLMRR